MDPRRELSAILKDGGGLRLGYKLMKEALREHILIMSTVERRCWDWYTNEVENCKSPADNLARMWKLSGGNWADEPHLFLTIQDSLLDPAKLDYMEIPFGTSDRAAETLDFCWTLVYFRGWTMTKHTAPPDCYCRLLQPGESDANNTVKQNTAAMLKTHHENVLRLETARHAVPDAMTLWTACFFLLMQPVRLIFELFRRDRYAADSADGRHLLTGTVATLPDNKIVEDIHAPLRLAGKHNSNLRLSSANIQDVINHSNVIETRGIPHRAAVDKDT